MTPHRTPLALSQLALALAATGSVTAWADGITLQSVPLTAGEIQYGQVHAQIGANAAYAAGMTGLGATVALLDTGVQREHIELFSQVAGTKMYDATRRRNVAISDGNGHGTLVAGVIAGSTGTGLSYGVAPDATILPIRIFSSKDWTTSVGALTNGLKKAASNSAVSVINLSIGGAAPLGGIEGALRKAIKADKLIVAAAGNAGDAAPLWPARYAKEAWAKGQIIAAGVVDATNQIASFSNRAGDTANWYLVAPGLQVMSSSNDGGYVAVSGTSVSAAVVSGAAALLEGAWPQLKAQQVAAILLQTATDLGAPGIDPIYGRGLLNVEQAMQPSGPLSVPVPAAAKGKARAGTAKRVASAPLDTSVATWSGLRAAALDGRFEGIVVDAFNRDFATDLGAGIRAPARERLTDMLDSAGRPLQFVEQQFPDGSRLLAVAEADATPRVQAGSEPGARALLASSATFRLTDGREVAFASGTLAGSYFGLAQTDPQLASPWLGLTRPAAQVAVGAEFGRLQFRTGVLTAADSSTRLASRGRIGGHAAVGEFDYAVRDDIRIGLQWADITEREAFLGTISGGAMGLDGARTRSLSTWASHQLTDKLLVAAQYSIARTADTQGRGLMRALDGVRADAFAFGVIGRSAFVDNDRLALTFSSPMRITAGNARIAVPVDIAENGDAIFESRRIPLASTSRELRLGFDYTMPLAHRSSLSMALDLRHNADHVAGEQDARIALIFRNTF